MSVVAWDGKSIAADKQGTLAGMRFTATKLKRLKGGAVVAGTADFGAFGMMVRWFEQGADAASYPKCQEDKEDWARLIVAWPHGLVEVYERQPVAYKVEDPFMAWGSGRDYAMGAMARGATAREAVEIAMRFDHHCGMGIDEVTFA